jgi:hypothetical protein
MRMAGSPCYSPAARNEGQTPLRGLRPRIAGRRTFEVRTRRGSCGWPVQENPALPDSQRLRGAKEELTSGSPESTKIRGSKPWFGRVSLIPEFFFLRVATILRPAGMHLPYRNTLIVVLLEKHPYSENGLPSSVILPLSSRAQSLRMKTRETENAKHPPTTAVCAVTKNATVHIKNQVGTDSRRF